MSDTVLPAPVEFPITFAAYAASVKGTPEEVWTLLMKTQHGDRPRTPSAWQALREALIHTS
jgi:hypothetical protein